MLQHTETEWAPAIKPSEAFTTASHRAKAMPASLTASLNEAPVLNESAPTELAAAMSSSNFSAMTLSTPGSSAASTGINYADTAVTALAMIGIWLMVVGIALLSRRLRLVRSDRENTLSEAAWQRQLRTAARQTPV